MSEQNKKPPALSAAKSEQQSGMVVERHGVRGRFVAMPFGLAQDAMSQVESPKVPVVFMEEKGRSEENPLDPDYQAALAECNRERQRVFMECMCMFGIELLDPIPEDGKWVRRLKFLEKRGDIDLSWVDWKDEIDVEFVFKRYVWSEAQDVVEIQRATGIGEELIGSADSNFRREETGNTDQ